MKMIDIKVKDQFGDVQDAKALLKDTGEQDPALKLCQQVEHIIVDDEILLPSTELYFESQTTARIYKIIEQ